MEQPKTYKFPDDDNYFTSNRTSGTSGTSGNIYVITFSAPILKNTLESIDLPGTVTDVGYELDGSGEYSPIVSRFLCLSLCRYKATSILTILITHRDIIPYDIVIG